VELNKVLSKVRGLVALAEHEGTPPAEAALAREQADALMLKYAIDEITADQAKPIGERSKPVMIKIDIGTGSDIVGYVAGMASNVARHTRCKVRHYTGHKRDEQGHTVWESTVYGFESDVRYFEVLYTTLRLHMLGALQPKIQTKKSLEFNAYQLHEAGYNWLEIAGLYGWKKRTYGIHKEHERGQIPDDMYEKWQASKAEIWYSEKEDEYRTNWQLGSKVKRAYHNEVKARGEQPTRISAGGTKTFRQSAAQGYLNRIASRLYEAARTRKAGTEVMLTGRLEDLEDFYRESNSNLYTRCPACGKLSDNPYTCDRCGAKIADEPKTKPTSGRRRSVWHNAPFNEQAYNRGVSHANNADISGGARGTGSGRKTEIN